MGKRSSYFLSLALIYKNTEFSKGEKRRLISSNRFSEVGDFVTKRYLGNKNHMEVHDLENEKSLCQISEIKPEHKRYFDSLNEARRRGYDNCHYCLGGSTG